MWSIWEAMKYGKHGLGVRLTIYQLSNPSHHTSSNLSFHIYEMGIINQSSKDCHKHKMKLFCFSSHRGISGIVIGDVSEAILTLGTCRKAFLLISSTVSDCLTMVMFIYLHSIHKILSDIPLSLSCYGQTIIFMPRV